MPSLISPSGLSTATKAFSDCVRKITTQQDWFVPPEQPCDCHLMGRCGCPDCTGGSAAAQDAASPASVWSLVLRREPSEACNCSVVCQELNLAGSGHLGSVARSSISSFHRMLIWGGWCTSHLTHTVWPPLHHVPPPARVTVQQLLSQERGPSCHTINQVQIHARGQISPRGPDPCPKAAPKAPSLLLGPVLT